MTHRHHIDTVLSLISPTRNPVPKEGLTIFGVKKESKIIWRRRFCLYFRQNPGGTEKGPRPHPTHNPLRFQTELGVPNRLSWVGSRSIVEFLTALNNNLFHLFNLSCLFHKWFEYQGKKKTREKRKWYFVTKIVLTYCEKKLFAWSRKIFKIFEITRTIYLNSERSEQFLVTKYHF